ncbi:MAG: 4Fe-4S dicluster domain-containing protein, partial [Dehalococcoidia bacterium]
CRHCVDAACIDACITGAMHWDEQAGYVLLDLDKCIGCGTCTLVCPLGAVHIDRQTGKAVKCDGCHDRDVPRCVSVCPNGSLVALEIPSESISATARKSPHPLLV